MIHIRTAATPISILTPNMVYAVTPTLPDPSAPLVLKDGTRIDPRTGRVMRGGVGADAGAKSQYVEVPSNSEAQRIVTKTRRRLADLPDVPAKMNTVSAVLAYRLFGLTDTEVAIATGLTEQQVGIVQMTDAYTRMHTAVVESIIAADTDNVRDLFVRNASKSAQRVAELVSSDDEQVSLRAAKDVLDRAGHRPADVVEHRHRLEGGLTIEVIRRDVTVQMPTVDVTYKEMDDADRG